MPSTVGRERRREWMGSGRRRILCALCVLNLSCGSALQGRAAEGAQGGGIGSSAPTVEETGAAGDTDPSDSSPLSTAPPVSQTGTCLFGAFRVDLLVSEAPDGQYRLFPHYDTFDQPSMTLRSALSWSNAAKHTTEEEVLRVASAVGLQLDRPLVESSLPVGIVAIAWTSSGWFIEGRDPQSASQITAELEKAGLSVTTNEPPTNYARRDGGGGSVGCALS